MLCPRLGACIRRVQQPRDPAFSGESSLGNDLGPQLFNLKMFHICQSGGAVKHALHAAMRAPLLGGHSHSFAWAEGMGIQCDPHQGPPRSRVRWQSDQGKSHAALARHESNCEWPCRPPNSLSGRLWAATATACTTYNEGERKYRPYAWLRHRTR